MKKLISQFDTRKFGIYVTTPSCCGCCCCCCCSLATSITSSVLLAKRINHEGKVKNIPYKNLYVALAALFLPIAGLISYALIGLVGNTLQRCSTVTRGGSRFYPEQVYTNCTSPVANYFWVIAALVFIGVLAFLYYQVKLKHPLSRAFLVVMAIAGLMVAEAFVGAFLILSSAGIGYLIAIPFMFALVYKLYGKTFGKDTTQKIDPNSHNLVQKPQNPEPPNDPWQNTPQ